MKYRVRHFEASMTRDQTKIEQFVNSVQGEVDAINLNMSLDLTSLQDYFLLIVEKVF